MTRSAMIAAALAATMGFTATADARCACRVPTRSVAHHHRHAMRTGHRGFSRSVVDARGIIDHAQWDIELVPGRRITPLDTDPYLPKPGQPGFEGRVPVSMGYGGVATPPLRLPVRRGYDGFK